MSDAPRFTRQMFARLPAGRNVVSLHVGIDMHNQGALVKYRLADRRHETVYFPRLIAWQVRTGVDHALTQGHIADTRRRTGDARPPTAVERAFLEHQPDILQADWEGFGATGTPAVHRLEMHIIPPHVCLAQLIDPGRQIYIAHRLSIPAALYLRGYLRDAFADGQLDTDGLPDP